MEHFKSKDSRFAELHAKNRTMEAHRNGNEGDDQVMAAMKAEISMLQGKIGFSEAELAAKSLDGTLTSDEARVREYKAHADQLGVRVKKADEEIARLKANALLKEVEINEMNNAMQETENILRELKIRDDAIVHTRADETSTVGVQTALSGNVIGGGGGDGRREGRDGRVDIVKR